MKLESVEMKFTDAWALFQKVYGYQSASQKAGIPKDRKRAMNEIVEAFEALNCVEYDDDSDGHRIYSTACKKCDIEYPVSEVRGDEEQVHECPECGETLEFPKRAFMKLRRKTRSLAWDILKEELGSMNVAQTRQLGRMAKSFGKLSDFADLTAEESPDYEDGDGAETDEGENPEGDEDKS
jgi:hypothetical protein